jgi:hypothetical protein
VKKSLNVGMLEEILPHTLSRDQLLEGCHEICGDLIYLDGQMLGPKISESESM